MRLDQFKIGERIVHLEEQLDDKLSRFATLRYVGQTKALIETEYGVEYTVSRYSSSYDRFERYVVARDIDGLEKLGDDLVGSIEKAAWLGDEDRPNLWAPTPHMRQAIENWRNRRV